MVRRRAGSTAGSLPLRFFALLMVLGIVAAACGGGDGGGDDNATDTTGGAQTSETEPEGEPQYGGNIIFGLEADTSTPWTPARSLCAISCHQTMKSVYDSLTLPDDEGNAQPNLLETITPNDDFTEWTLVPRPDITFHDGTPFDAEAIRVNLQDHLDSSLTQVALKSIETVTTSPDGASAIVTMNESWSGFPFALMGQLGYMASPTWLAGIQSNPDADQTQPVGTGPFVFEEFVAGNRFVATRNDNYWKTDADGNELPYADSIEYRVFPEGEARVSAVISGQTNIAQTSSGDQIDRIRSEVEGGTLETLETDRYQEVGYIMVNQGGEEEYANDAIKDVRVRRAMAMAIDREFIRDTISAGVGNLANGPFPPGSIGYLEDTGYPVEYDPDGASALIEEYESETGEQVSVVFSTTNDPINLRSNQAVVEYWNDVGIDAEINQIEQGVYILEAVFGNFEAFAWRNHGGYDPDQQNVWWHSDSAADFGGLALNFNRFKDDVIDENLDLIRSSGDAAERQEAAENINRRFGEMAYNLWASWTIWALPHAPEVNGLDSATLPDGEPTIFGTGIAGTIQVANLWLEQ